MIVLPSLKNISTPCFRAHVFAALNHALDVWDNYIGLVVTASFVGVIDCPLISVCLPIMFDVCSS